MLVNLMLASSTVATEIQCGGLFYCLNFVCNTRRHNLEEQRRDMSSAKFDQKIIRVLFNSPSLAGKRKACDHRKQTLDRVQGGLSLANQCARLWVDMPTDP